MKKHKWKNYLLAAFCLCGLSACTSLEEAAKNGDADAQAEYAYKLMTGEEDFQRNPVEAKVWVDKAIKNGSKKGRIVKGNFILSGEYDKVNINECLNLLYPLVKHEKNEQAALILLKILFKNNDVSNIKISTELISILLSRDADYKITAETSLFLNECIVPYTRNALAMNNLSHEEQKNKIKDIELFIEMGWSKTRAIRKYFKYYRMHRVMDSFGRLKAELKKKEDLISRTVVIDAVGTSVRECRLDALKQALDKLFGVNVSADMEKNYSENISNDKESFNQSFTDNISGKYRGKFEKFETIISPQKGNDGMYHGRFKVIRAK